MARTPPIGQPTGTFQNNVDNIENVTLEIPTESDIFANDDIFFRYNRQTYIAYDV